MGANRPEKWRAKMDQQGRKRPSVRKECTMSSGFWRKGALSGTVLALALVVSVLLAACGEARDPNASAFSSDVVAQKVMISADAGGDNKWDKATYEAQAG